LTRRPRTYLAVLAALALVTVGACGGSSGTPTAPPISDPNEIITKALSGGQATTTLHLKLEITGAVKTAGLGDQAAVLGNELTLDGAMLEGDIDVANQAAHLTFSAPKLAALGNQTISGDLIIKDSNLYIKAAPLLPKYMKSPLGSLTEGLPVSVPTAGASALSGLTDQIAEVRKSLQDAGAKSTLVGTEQVDGRNAYHVNISVPLDKLNSQLAGSGVDAAAQMKIDSASVDMWTYTDSNQLAKVQIKGASSTVGNVGMTITMTKYGAAVKIEAPAASDIQESGSLNL
jgi:hypothetical protein